MLAVAVTPAQQKILDAYWRKAIPYGNSCRVDPRKVAAVLLRLHRNDPQIMPLVVRWIREMKRIGIL